MRKKYVGLMVLILVLLGTLPKAFSFDDGDFQIWHTENQDFKFKKNFKLTLEEEFRYGNNASEFFYQHYDGGLVFSLNKNLDLGINYRQVYEKKGGKFKEENRPHVNAILKFDLWKLKFEDRNRLEYRHFEYQNDFMRYRNKFALKYPFNFIDREITPYVSDEIFLATNGTGFNRNRFYSGSEFEIIKGLKGDIYYLLETNKSSNKWLNANVLGLKLKVSF